MKYKDLEFEGLELMIGALLGIGIGLFLGAYIWV